ncbi:MAG: alpha-2-macroglobulin [Pseudomonadota bacterium]
MTANKVDGPVTGTLPDKITLSIDPHSSNSPNLQDRAPLSVSFCTETSNMEKVLLDGKYVLQPRVYCNTPDRKLHLSGRRQSTGIAMVPEMPGEWRWRSDYTLMFKPKKAWPTGQHYQLTFKQEIFPDQVKLNNGSYSLDTEPLVAQIPQMEFFQDHENVEKKAVTTTIRFNSPVDTESLKQHLEFTLEELTDDSKPNQRKVIAKAENVPFEINMNERATEAVISTPLTSLPDKERFLKVVIKPGLVAKSGGKPLTYVANGPGRFEQRVAVPSRFSYAKIDKIDLRVVKNDRYVPEQMLIITTNVPVTSEELVKHLKIRLLPKDKAAESSAYSAKKDYAWTSANEVTDALFDKAPEVKFTPLPTAEPYATLHSVKLDTEAGRWIYARITGGLNAKGDYVLEHDHNDTLRVPEYEKEVQLLSDGALLSLNGERKVSVFSLGARKLKFDVKRVITSDIGHFISQTRGDFEKPEFENYQFSENNVSESFSEEISLPQSGPRTPQFSAFDFTPYLKKNPDAKGLFKGEPHGKGLFFLTINAIDRDKDGKETVVSNDKRFVLVSDLGLIVKTNRDGSHDAFVQSVQTGKPVSGATIEVLGTNGLAVLKLETDSDGHANIPNLSGFINEKAPVAYVVRNDDDLAFMPYSRSDRSLNYSKFETDGIHTSEEGLKAFLFSERGIYRPGDAVHIGIVVKQGNWAQNLEGLPLRLEITNPRGQVIDKPLLKMNAVGFVEYHFSTKDISPTGVYNVRLYITKDGAQGNALGSTSVRVEEFLPDTMKITSEFNKPVPKGWITPEGLKTTVTLQHLYGAPAVDYRVKAGINLSPGSFAFPDYADYSFFDALKAEKSFDQPIGSNQTDAEGKTTFDLNLSQFGDSTYRLTFSGEGFAADSGRSVKTARSVLVSPLPYVVGVKANNLGYISKGDARKLSLIALDPDLKAIAASGLTTKLLQITYVSTLVKDERGAYAYRSIPKESVVANGTMNIAAKGLAYPLATDKPGSYALVVSNAKGLVLNRIPYTVVGTGSMMGQVRKDAPITIKLDKPEYNAGDKIEMNIVSPYTGAGLITIETDKVLSYKWFSTDSTSSVQTIAIPKRFTGKGFVNVQFLRAIDSKEIYTKPLAFAVVPFMVSTASVDSAIALEVPEKAKPGDKLTIHYSMETPGKIIIYAVDEGILQYGHYVTPNPLEYFIGKRALQVATAQILDLLMPEYSIMQQLAAPGGDRSLTEGKNLNPFKRKTLPPVVFWSGVIDADEKPRQVTYQIPEYFNGGLKVMAVAVSERTIGAAEAKTAVKGDLIVTPNVPTFAAPGDEFVVGVSVANNIVGSGKNAKLKLAVAPSEHLEILEGKETTLSVPEGTEAKMTLRVKPKDVLGGASLKFIATAAGKSSKYEATLSVRPPLPSMTALSSGYADKGEKTVAQERDLYKEFGTGSAAVSTLPVSLIPGLSAYLERFPYGCTEQTISKAMPAVILAGQKDLGGDSKLVEQGVVNAMNRLRELQQPGGGFGYWWRGGSEDEFISTYALHYMTLAKEKHLPVPDETFRQTQQYVKELVNRSPSSLDQARVQAYGIYLLTRNGEVTANYLPNLLQYLNTKQKDAWKQDLTAVYIAASYKLMQLAPEANKLMDEFALGDPVSWAKNPRFWWSESPYYNSMNRYAQYLTVISNHFPERLPQLDRNILFRIANFIGEGSYNTLSSSYAIMAFSSYGQASSQQTQAQLSIAQADAAGKLTALALTGTQVKRAALSVDKNPVTFAGGGKYGLFYQITTDGYDRARPTHPIQDGLEINHHYLDADQKPVKEVAIGDTVFVVVTMRAHDDKTLTNMAVVDLLPAGFEVVPESIARPVETRRPSRDEDDEEAEDDSATMTPANDDASFDGQPWEPEMVDAREDRVIAFGTVPSELVTWHYKIKAVNAGSFVTPPPYVESMYERAVKARGVVGTITVK